ncbi:MAG: phosphoribosyltransferase family protein [Ferruginibacter sp.]
MPVLPSFVKDVIHLFFPHHCAGCGSDIIANDHFLCIDCMSRLPYTGYEKIPGNPVENIFTGRTTVEAASSAFYFSKGHLVQQLIHQLKYKGNKEAGEYLGLLTGKALLASGRFSQVDYLVPLPLYPDKEFRRGYNQAAVICHGISSILHVPVHSNNVIRKRATETQTKKHRTERWENVEGSFLVRHPEQLAGKKILLVDDVITTGATLEACAQVIVAIPGVTLSICTLAVAGK